MKKKTDNIIPRKVINESGIPTLVLLPEGETDAKLGIPLSLDLSPLFGHMPIDFQKALYEALHANGLILPADYFKPGADQRFKAAMLSVIRHDFLSVQSLAKTEKS